MKNVLLIGDSIRVGYDKSVKASLEGIADVRFPIENCRFAAYVLRHFNEWVAKSEFENIDVVHWNAGLWDVLRQFGEEPNTPLEIYKYFIDRVCVRIKKFAPNAKVIFATSTAVRTEKMNPEIFIRYNEEIEQYNAAAIEIVKKYGFEVNDLYAVSQSLPDEAHSDNVHYYTQAGTEAFTKATLVHIAKALELEEVPEYVEVMHKGQPIGF